MRLSECIEILARRLQLNRGRTAGIANRLQHAGLVQTADSKRTPPDIGHAEIASLLIAVLVETGLAHAAEATRAASDWQASDYRLHDALVAILHGQSQPGDIIVRQGGASATIDGLYQVFGSPAEDGPARFVTGPTLAAIVAELQGAAPHDADAVAAITRISNGNR